MSSEPRSKNYPHVYQRSLDAVKDTPGEPVLWQVMRALALDPLEAQDAKEEQEWPDSDFAAFCAHPDKNGRQAALETIATWMRQEPQKKFSNSMGILAAYDRRISLWTLLEVPRPWVTSNILNEKMRSKIAESIRLANSWVASENEDPNTIRLIRRAGGYFERELGETQDADESIDAMRRWCASSMDAFTSLVDDPGMAFDFVGRASQAISESRRATQSYNVRRDGALAVMRSIKEQVINRILSYPYNW